MYKTYFLIFCCVFFSDAWSEEIGSDSELWSKTISKVITSPLWNTRDSYDSGHVLMVPLHYVFVAKDIKGIKQFEKLFAKFARRELGSGQLNQLHWLYLVSRYLALKKEFNYKFKPVDYYLVERLSRYVHVRWLYLPLSQWGKYPFAGTKKRLDYIFTSELDSKPSYYKAVTDREMFLFSISADLKYIITGLNAEIENEIKLSLDDIYRYALIVLKKRGKFTESGWLFQQGIWEDHPTVSRAGFEELSADLPILKRQNISEDSSHSHRWSLWLRSMILAASHEKKEKEYLKKIYVAFSKQFKEHVVVKDSFIKLNNYMDGYNGIYRYKYTTVGLNKKLGYGPYGLSGVMGLSWYCFLDGMEVIYKKYSESYPLKKHILELYVGPNTTRDRNKAYQRPGFFTEGFAYLLSIQSLYLSREYRLVN